MSNITNYDGFNLGRWLIDDNGNRLEHFGDVMNLLYSYGHYLRYNLRDFVQDSCHTSTYEIGNSRELHPFAFENNIAHFQMNRAKHRARYLLGKGWLRRSTSQFISSVSLQYNIDNRFDIIPDYNHLNHITPNFPYPVPTRQDVINRIPESSYFSKIVLLDAFHQIRLHNNSRALTSFVIDNQHFELTTLHPLLKHSEAILQCAVENTVYQATTNNDIRRYISVYQDKILVSTPTYEDHMSMLLHLFGRFHIHNFKVDRIKSCFLTKHINYLYRFICLSGHSIPDEKKALIENYPLPQTHFDLNTFLYLIREYQAYIDFGSHDIEITLRPLINTLHLPMNIHWNPYLIGIFTRLKNAIHNSAPIPCAAAMHWPFLR